MENKTGKYFKYAIGEIILVVIGILIALSINNWNEQKADKERFTKILIEMQNDLISDIKNAKPLLQYGKLLDSLCKKVIDNEFTYSDYRKPDNDNLFWVGLQFTPFNFQTTAFNKINNFQGIIPEEFNAILGSINDQYINKGSVYNSLYDALREQIKYMHNYLAEHFDWYILLRKKNPSDEMIDFYLNNPIYKNWVAQFKSDNSARPLHTLHRLQLGAVHLYFEIHKLLGKTELAPEIISVLGEPLGNDAEDFIGTYEFEDDLSKIQITNNFGYLMFNKEIVLTEIKKDYFEIQFMDIIFEFNRDDSGQIIGVIGIEDGQKSYAKKIKYNDQNL